MSDRPKERVARENVRSIVAEHVCPHKPYGGRIGARSLVEYVDQVTDRILEALRSGGEERVTDWLRELVRTKNKSENPTDWLEASAIVYVVNLLEKAGNSPLRPSTETDAPGEGEHPGVKEAEDLRDMLAMTADEARAWKPDPDEGSGEGDGDGLIFPRKEMAERVVWLLEWEGSARENGDHSIANEYRDEAARIQRWLEGLREETEVRSRPEPTEGPHHCTNPDCDWTWYTADIVTCLECGADKAGPEPTVEGEDGWADSGVLASHIEGVADTMESDLTPSYDQQDVDLLREAARRLRERPDGERVDEDLVEFAYREAFWDGMSFGESDRDGIPLGDYHDKLDRDWKHSMTYQCIHDKPTEGEG